MPYLKKNLLLIDFLLFPDVAPPPPFPSARILGKFRVGVQMLSCPDRAELGGGPGPGCQASQGGGSTHRQAAYRTFLATE